MGWSMGFDDNWNRDIGYGVVAYCDHPECNETIDRGLSHVCCNQEPYGGDDGCGLYFCGAHQSYTGKCERCQRGEEPFEPKLEHPKWVVWKHKESSWTKWRRTAEGKRWLADRPLPDNWEEIWAELQLD